MDLQTCLASSFEIPIIRKDQNIWFFRTKGGKYYEDFTINNYIALGWDRITPELIIDYKVSKEIKRAKVVELYPSESRPGLILAQMDTFYNKMKNGDLVVIPNDGGKEVTIGCLGDLVTFVERDQKIEYDVCSYEHKRNVQWIKVVESWQDVYFFKVIKAHQTISNITEEAKLVYRNIYPVYITDDNIHLTLQKKTMTDLNMSSSVELQMNILQLADTVAELYGRDSFRESMVMKSAVGSPGFMEFIFPGIPVAVVSVGILIKFLIGKHITIDGSITTGISAVISMVNQLLNDHTNRKKVEAEIELIRAQTKKTDADAESVIANKEKTLAEKSLMQTQIAINNQEARKLELENLQIELLINGRTTEENRIEQEQLLIPDDQQVRRATASIIQNGKAIQKAASKNDISFEARKIKSDN